MSITKADEDRVKKIQDSYQMSDKEDGRVSPEVTIAVRGGSCYGTKTITNPIRHYSDKVVSLVQNHIVGVTISLVLVYILLRIFT